jgi:hypothetical protein
LLVKEPSGENRVVKAKSIMDLARALSRKLSIREDRIESDHEDKEQPNYCPICYTNEIVPSPNPLNQITWEFTCGHRFCVECTREDMRIKINQFDIEKLICLQDQCKKKVTTAELTNLFGQTEPETL